MKHLYIILVTLLFIGCSEKTVLYSELNIDFKENVYYFKSKPYTGIVYTFYQNGQIKSSRDFKDGKYHGLTKSFFENGQQYTEINRKEGKRDGLSKQWYPNGQLRYEEYYNDGIRTGSIKEWYVNGQLKYEVNFKDGFPVSDNCWDQWGNKVDKVSDRLYTGSGERYFKK